MEWTLINSKYPCDWCRGMPGVASMLDALGYELCRGVLTNVQVLKLVALDEDFILFLHGS